MYFYDLFGNFVGYSKPRANGVIFMDGSGRSHWAYLRRGLSNEVIVCSGALGSPQLLMLSGIGPQRHLEAHNIPVVLHKPLVGQGMSDNPMNAVFVPSPRPVEVSLIQVVGITHNGSYIEGASGENFASETQSARDFGMFSPKVYLIVKLTLGITEAHKYHVKTYYRCMNY